MCLDSFVCVLVSLPGSLLSETPIAAFIFALVFLEWRLGPRFLAISR